MGEASGDYQPRGYIVEYGGMPGDPILNLSASTKISVAAISTTVGDSRCGDGTLNLSATATLGATVLWFDSFGTKLWNGDTFITPPISTTKTLRFGFCKWLFRGEKNANKGNCLSYSNYNFSTRCYRL